MKKIYAIMKEEIINGDWSDDTGVITFEKTLDRAVLNTLTKIKCDNVFNKNTKYYILEAVEDDNGEKIASDDYSKIILTMCSQTYVEKDETELN